MNFFKKLLSAVIAFSLLVPYAAFAEYDAEREFNFDVALFSDEGNEPILPVLTDTEAEFIRFIADEIKNRQPTAIPISEDYKITATRFGEISTSLIKLIQDDYPEIYYLLVTTDDIGRSLTQIGCRYTDNEGDDEDFITEVNIDYRMTRAEIRKTNNMINHEVQNITTGITDDMTDYEKILIVHDYIVNNYRYDERLNNSELSGQENRYIDSFVAEKRGVCQAYSHLFKYVMDKLGIPCETVPASELAHMWNKVQVGGKWYNIDLTYDDPVLGNVQDYVMPLADYHEFFLVTDTEIRGLDPEQHEKWDEYNWDGKTPATVSAEEPYPNNQIRDVKGPTVYSKGKFYALNNVSTTRKNQAYIVAMDFKNHQIGHVYTIEDDFWTKEDQNGHRFSIFMSNLVSYKGDAYFNTAGKVYRINPKDYENPDVIYSFVDENPDKVNEHNTYLSGLVSDDLSLYAKYTESQITTEAIEGTNYFNFIRVMHDDLITILSDIPPCSYDIRTDEEQNIVVTLEIPEHIEKAPSVYIAEYDANGALIGLVPRENDAAAVTFTPDESTQWVKAFIWTDDNRALSFSGPYEIEREASAPDTDNPPNEEDNT